MSPIVGIHLPEIELSEYSVFSGLNNFPAELTLPKAPEGLYRLQKSSNKTQFSSANLVRIIDGRHP